VGQRINGTRNQKEKSKLDPDAGKKRAADRHKGLRRGHGRILINEGEQVRT